MLEFLAAYHGTMGKNAVPVICVPTTYNVITEAELYDAGVSIVIYANHMLRAAYPTMLSVAESILTNSRSLEADSDLLPVKKVRRGRVTVESCFRPNVVIVIIRPNPWV